MDVRNCKLCGNLFNFDGLPICPSCNKEMEAKFVELKEYIRENPKVPMAKVSEEVGVPVQIIKRWVREERIQFAKDSGVSIDCERCGKAILTGRYCKECKKEMTHSFDSLYKSDAPKKQEKKKDGNARMRFLG